MRGKDNAWKSSVAFSALLHFLSRHQDDKQIFPWPLFKNNVDLFAHLIEEEILAHTPTRDNNIIILQKFCHLN
jgi:hypothetical protein